MDNSTTRQLQNLWERSPTLDAWAAETVPAANLIWKEGHAHQIENLRAMAHLLGLDVRVAGDHTSKSVKLPVGMFEFHCKGSSDSPMQQAFVFTRDNFIDLKLVVMTTAPLRLPYDVVHSRMTTDEYGAEKARAYAYEHRLRLVSDPRFEGDDWVEDWCHESIIRETGVIYRCSTTASCYYEGINRIVPDATFTRYEHGARDFACEVERPEQAMRIIRAVRHDLARYARVSEQHARYEAIEPSERYDWQNDALIAATADLRARGLDL